MKLKLPGAWWVDRAGRMDIAILTLSILTLGLPSESKADVSIGSFDVGTCYPFSCFANDYGVGGTYQAVYTSSAFSGKTKIYSISLFQGDGPFGTGMTDSASFNVSFYTTSASIGALSSTLSDNRGVLLSDFGDYTFSGAPPSVLTLKGNAFNYDPSDGNLLIQVVVTGLTQRVVYHSFFWADNTGTKSSVAFGNSSISFTEDIAPVIRFNTTAVPEPASWAMMLIGQGALGAMMRSRRRAAVVA